MNHEVIVGLRVHLINPSSVSFGVAVITPRWLYVLAAATGTEWGDPCLVDETLDPVDFSAIASGDLCRASRLLAAGRFAAGDHPEWSEGRVRSRAAFPSALRSSTLKCLTLFIMNLEK